MLQETSRRALALVVFCTICLAAGALPAAALPSFDSSPLLRGHEGSWIARLWQAVGEPVVALFATDATLTPPPTPPTSESGMTIDPDGVPGP